MSWSQEGREAKRVALKKAHNEEVAAAYGVEVRRIRSHSQPKYPCKRNKGEHEYEEFIGMDGHIEYPWRPRFLGNYVHHLFICKHCGKKDSRRVKIEG